MRITNHRKEFRGKPPKNAGLGMKQQLGYIGEERIGIAMPKKKSTTIARQGGQEASNQTKPIKLDWKKKNSKIKMCN